MIYFVRPRLQADRIDSAVNYYLQNLSGSANFRSFQELEDLYSTPACRISHSTLARRVAMFNKPPKVDGRRYLSDEEELLVFEHVSAANEDGGDNAISTNGLFKILHRMIRKKNNGDRCAMPADNVKWLRGALKRHKMYNTVFAQRQDNKRFTANNSTTVIEWNLEIKEKLTSGVYSRIWNYDETMILGDVKFMTKLQRDRYIHRIGGVIPTHRQPDCHRKHVTYAPIISNDGILGPCLIIFKNKGNALDWMKPDFTDPFCKDWGVVSTKSGFVDGKTLEDWLKQLVEPNAAKGQVGLPKLPDGKRQLLVIDGCASHHDWDLVKWCSARGVDVAFLPPNLTHIFQPLDVLIFGIFKKS